MVTMVLVTALLVGIPTAYMRGKRIGFERHHCVWVPESQDRAPQRFVTLPCPACGEGVDCALHLHHRFLDGVPQVSATVDATDLEHHTLTHVDELRRNAG
jgi:hypothetical protein